MIKTLWKNFLQAFTGTILWVIILITLFRGSQLVPIYYLWNVAGIGILLALTFGVLYPFLWEYSTFKASLNIVISTIFNATAGILSVFLYSRDMFDMIRPYTLFILLLTLAGHILGFYFYSNFQNKKIAKQLNQNIENKL